MRITRKKVIAATTALVIAGASGMAFAYWSTSGSGSGSATTSAGAANLTVTQTGPLSAMYPGDQAQTISGTVKNNAANSAYVAQVVVSISSVTKGGNVAAGCDASDYDLSSPTMNVGTDVASGAEANFSGATIKFNNKATNQDACKGATVNLAYAAS